LNKILKSILLFLCVFAVVQIGAGIAASVFAGQTWNLLVSMAVMYLVIFLCVFAFTRTDGIGLRKLGFRKVADWKSLTLVGGLVGFVAQLTIFLLVAAVSTIFFFEYFGYPINYPTSRFYSSAVDRWARRGNCRRSRVSRLHPKNTHG